MRVVLSTGAVAALLALTACSPNVDVQVPEPDVPDVIQVSSDFASGDPLPTQFTCDGAGEFPPIRWGQLPEGTEAVAVLVNDPDAPGGDFIHRLVTNLDPDAGALDSAGTPDGALELPTSEDVPGWVPPCPPEGEGPHRYVFTVYALDRVTRVPDDAQPQTGLTMVDLAAFAFGQVTAEYERG
jgi:Raf kinase inhibitor-like YbhB/YbcL family protein